MKRILSLILVTLIAFHTAYGYQIIPEQVTIGEQKKPDASAALELRGAGRGLLINRLTSTERDGIAAPATGLIIFNSTANIVEYYNGSSWVPATGGSITQWLPTADYVTNDIVVDSSKIYRAVDNHTSTTDFATDFLAGHWELLSGGIKPPLGATDNALVRFDGTTGDSGQNSVVTLNDTGDMVGLSSVAIGGVKDASSILDAISTTHGTRPCPSMTEAERDAISSPASGLCIYNTTQGKLNLYNGTLWKSAGGGIEPWVTAFAYSVNDVVIESAKIYQALNAHTSTTFATDLANGDWVELAAYQDQIDTLQSNLDTVEANLQADITTVTTDLSDHVGNTSNPHSVTKAQVGLGNVVDLDTSTTANITDSTNKRFVDDGDLVDIDNLSGTNTGDLTTKTEQGSAVVTNEIQFPNKQATTTAAGKVLANTGSTNEFANSGFEGLDTADYTITGVTAPNISLDTTAPLSGKQSLKLVTTGAWSVRQSSTINVAQQNNVQKTCSLQVSADTSDVQLCSLKAGVEDKCTNSGGYVANSGKKTLTVSYLATSSTSNGCVAKGTASGTVRLDTFTMGDGAPIVDFGTGSEFVGKVTYTSSTGCFWNTASTSWASFAADADCLTPTASGSVTIPSTKIPAIVIPNYKAGHYLFQVVAYGAINTLSLTGGGGLRVADGTLSSAEMTSFSHGVANTSAPSSSVIVGSITNPTNRTNATIQVQGYTTNAANPSGVAVTSSNAFEIAVYYFPEKPNSSAYVASSSEPVGALYSGATGTITSSYSLVKFTGKENDSGDNYNTSTGIYSVPESDYYDIDTQLRIQGTYTSAQAAYIGVSVGGTTVKQNVVPGYSTEAFPSLSIKRLYLAKGEQLSVVAASTATSPSIVASTNSNYFSISKSNKGIINGTFEGHNWTTERFSGNGSTTAFTLAASPATIENTFVSINGVLQQTSTYSISGTTLTFSEAPPTGTNNIEVRQAKINAAAVPSDGSVTPAKLGTQGIPFAPGVTSTNLHNFSFTTNNGAGGNCTTGACTVVQTGNAVSGVNWTATGSYTLNLARTYSKLICVGNALNAGVGYVLAGPIACSNCATTSWQTVSAVNTTTSVNSISMFQCTGEY